MGILDNEMRPHLERVTKDFEANKDKWMSDLHTIHTQKSLVKNPEIYKSERQEAAEKFQERGNFFLKAQCFEDALHMFSESLAAAVDGPLASTAFFNRLIPFVKNLSQCKRDINYSFIVCLHPFKFL
jgi:hypothetical protein